MNARKTADAPLMTAEQAGQLLDSVVLEQVGSLIDFEALSAFESTLACALIGEGMAQEQAEAIAYDLIERAFDRVRDLRMTAQLHSPMAGWSSAECSLCRDVAAIERPKRSGRSD